MKSLLVLFGVLFLVVGGLLFLIPNPSATATTESIGANGAEANTYRAEAFVPPVISLALMIIGALLLIFGLIGERKEIVVEDRPIETEEYDEVRYSDDGHTIKKKVRKTTKKE